MEGLMHFLQQSDAVGGSVALLLLLMSIGAWALIIWKTLVLRRVMGDLNRAIPAFWDGAADSQRTRRLRDALQQGLGHLQFGQVVLASIGSTSPFIGLFGTVWGIYHALVAIGTGGAFSIDKVAGPVGEALVMTAAGLAVAIPAVLGYNALVRGNKFIIARMNRFAHDLHAYYVTGTRVTHNGGQHVV